MDSEADRVVLGGALSVEDEKERVAEERRKLGMRRTPTMDVIGAAAETGARWYLNPAESLEKVVRGLQE